MDNETIHGKWWVFNDPSDLLDNPPVEPGLQGFKLQPLYRIFSGWNWQIGALAVEKSAATDD